MSLRIHEIRFFRLPMETRFPFRYGIASMTQLPHLFVRANVEFDGRVVAGISAEGLPPKWFTKNPITTFADDDLPGMLSVIRHAAAAAVDIGSQTTFFDWWKELHETQFSWAHATGVAPLLAGLGFSLIERAVIDAFCRAKHVRFFDALRDNAFAIDLGWMRDELRDLQPADVLPAAPGEKISVRHTIGLGDPLQDKDVAVGEEVADGLPYSLAANIRAYGLRYFKIKLNGRLEVDRDRLRQIVEILNREVLDATMFTLDGNENYATIAEFRSDWESHRADPVLREIFDRGLLFVEQPVHRDTALEDGVKRELDNWADAPSIIIDESDADLSCLPRALSLGYSGTSHKNCKGVFKGLAQLATVSQRRNQGINGILSAEDLCNVGPVALLQDLAASAAFGIEHVERNGHHFFAGLSMLPHQEQERTLERHSDLYTRSTKGFPTLAIQNGCVNLTSVNASPFGVGEHPDVSAFEEWDF
ncbi:MAG: hypothetical protein O2856_15015 [Planctomycetota bacterium]|nr:hypothetical protein [Planctomycetota bacterium]